MDYSEIENRFEFHPATGTKGMDHHEVRKACRDLAVLFAKTLPDGREKSLAITKLEECMFWSNAAVARNS